MPSFLLTKIALCLLCFIPLVLPLLLLNREAKKRERERKMPFSNKAFRIAGESAKKKADHHRDTGMEQLTKLLVVSCIGIAVIFVSKGHWSFYVLCFLVMALFTWSSFIKMKAELAKFRAYSLGAMGERVVGDRLMRELLPLGYQVFHDVELESGSDSRKFNIDHVVVGQKGVYAIETKTRAKLKSLDENYTVNAYEERIEYPNWTDRKSIQQARRGAKSLQDKLASYVTSDLQVQWLVVLPGWYVKNLAREARFVQNDKNIAGLIQQQNDSCLSDQELKAIVGRLNELSQNVEYGN